MSIRKNPIYLLVLIIVALIIVIVYRYDQYVIKDNFILTAAVVCDPSNEGCFVADCDATDPACDVTPYKKVSILASEALECVQEHSCETFQCVPGTSCKITYCSEASLEDGEICLLP